jgi:hypothetical protein
MATAVLVRRAWRGGFDAGRAGDGDVRLGQFGEFAVLCASALNAIVLFFSDLATTP